LLQEAQRQCPDQGAKRPRPGAKARDGAVEVIVAVDVRGPVIVAVHVHVIDP